MKSNQIKTERKKYSLYFVFIPFLSLLLSRQKYWVKYKRKSVSVFTFNRRVSLSAIVFDKVFWNVIRFLIFFSFFLHFLALFFLFEWIVLLWLCTHLTSCGVCWRAFVHLAVRLLANFSFQFCAKNVICCLLHIHICMYRLWSSGCRSRYQGPMGRLKFLKRPFCIIGKCNQSSIYWLTIILCKLFFFFGHLLFKLKCSDLWSNRNHPNNWKPMYSCWSYVIFIDSILILHWFFSFLLLAQIHANQML